MQYTSVLLLGLSVAIFPAFSAALAQVNKDSRIQEARYPASRLDLILYKIQSQWALRFVISPNPEMLKKHPLITRAGVSIELYYSALDDQIFASAFISDTDGFLSLSEKKRKELVRNVLRRIWVQLLVSIFTVDQNTGTVMSGIKNRHIRLSVRLSDIMENDKKERIRLDLPADTGIGQAGYKDGQFVYSESYFLKLKVVKGRAKSGNATKFVIERE